MALGFDSKNSTTGLLSQEIIGLDIAMVPTIPPHDGFAFFPDPIAGCIVP